MTLINFEKIESILSDEENKKLLKSFNDTCVNLYETNSFYEVYSLCEAYLTKYNNKYSNNDLVDKVKYELVKSSNLIILDLINSDKNSNKIKKLIEVCESIAIKDFSLYMMTINNKCCYLFKNNFVRCSIDLMEALKSIYSLQKTYSLCIYNKYFLNNYNNSNEKINSIENIDTIKVLSVTLPDNMSYTKDIANCYLQLCAFNSKIKNHVEALSNGMQSLILNQFVIVDKIIDKNINSNKELNTNTSELGIYSKVSNEMELTLSYYNVGAEQEHLKRVIL